MTSVTTNLRAVLLGTLALAGCGDDIDPTADCTEAGTACTWLGVTGEVGFTKDGKSRSDTTVYWTMDTLFARDGVTWFIDWNNHLVRNVTPDGNVHTVVGWSDPVFPGDGNENDQTLERSTEGSPGNEVQLNHPTDLHEMPDGQVLLMAWHNHKLRSIDPATGRVRILAGAGVGFRGDGGTVDKALFKQPSRLAVDEAQNIFILDQGNMRIRRIDAATQIITTVAGNGMAAFGGDDGPATAASMNFQTGSNPEPDGGLAYHQNALYIADSLNNRIRKVDLGTGMITTIAGTGEMGYGGDGGPALAAMLYNPRDLEIGPDGDLYIADTNNGAVRALNLTTGVIRTVVGNGSIGQATADNCPTDEMTLHRTFGIDFDPAGNLFVSDSLNSRIVKVVL